MKLPVSLPSSLHLDIAREGECLFVDQKTDALIQREMILVHKHLLQERAHREISNLEAIQSWITNGYAAAYRKHYKIIQSTSKNAS